MSELKECPFCGSCEERPIDHAKGCFLRMWAESIDAMYHDEPMPHSVESMRSAWNVRADREIGISEFQKITKTSYLTAKPILESLADAGARVVAE